MGEAPAAGRPAPLLEVLPQEQVQRRTVEQIDDPVPVVPMLFMVEPQMVEQLVDMLSPLDFRVAEQVIDVPKIVCPPRAARTVLRAPQLAEQLVEVPTPVCYSSLSQRIMEQNVDIQFLVMEGDLLVFKIFFPDRVQQCRLLRRSLTILLRVEVFKVFAQDRVHLHHSHLQLVFMNTQMSLVKVFFGLFSG